MTDLQLRAALFFSMTILISLSVITGFVLYLWPHGPRSGQFLFFGLTKEMWIDLHTYLSILAVAVMVMHIILNRRFIKIYYKLTVKGEQ
ncbi:MAG: DUF4405 domain-containing protein [Candidatus Bathyarchaeia archaeon]